MTTAGDAMARFEALRSAAGRDLLDRLGSEDDTRLTDPDQVFRLGAALRADYPGDLVAAALAQVELRILARAKFTRADRMFFTRAGLEQASAELTSRHRSRRYAGFARAGAGRVVDLCAGVGGDLVALAETGPVLAVDRDPLHLWMAGLNAAVYDVADRVETLESDVRAADLSGAGAVFIDPARRSEGRRLPAGTCEPDLSWCFGVTEKVSAVGIKAAPGLPHRSVPAGWELEFVAVGRDLKEAVLWSPALATSGTRATLLPEGDVLVPDPNGPGEGSPVEIGTPGSYLLDPNPAVTRAGLVEELARRIGAWKIDERIAFLSTDSEARTPFARTLRVIESMPWHHRRLAERLHALEIGAVDIRRRGLAGDVDALRRRLRLRGGRRATLVMTRLRDRPWALICTGL